MRPHASDPVRKIAKPRRESYAAVRAVAVTAALALVLLAGGARAQDVYTVSGVEVDVTAETAAEARERAIARAHRQAFDRLVARLVPTSHQSALPRLPPSEIPDFVSSFGIDSEKRSNVRYIASLTFRFRQTVVRGHLQANNVPFAETRSKPVLVLPVYDFAGARLLWDEPNPWFEAWEKLPPSDGLLPLILPAGDLADVRDVSADQAANGARERLTAIAERYGASGVLVVTAKLGKSASTGRSRLDVSTGYTGESSPLRTTVRTFEPNESETLDDWLVRVAGAVARQAEDEWKSENLLHFDRLSELAARVSLTDLRDWVAIRKRLDGIAFLREVRMTSVSRREIELRLRYYGDVEQLRVAFAQRDLALSPVVSEFGESWQLREVRGRAAPSSGGSPDR